MPMMSSWIPFAPAKSRYAKGPGGMIKKFKFSDLEKMTLNFHPSNLIGKNCYKGVIANHFEKLEVVVEDLSGLQEKTSREWVREIMIFEEFEHLNLGKIIGYCAKGNKKKKYETGRYFIVYEFMKNGSVYEHLFDHTLLHGPLSWELRLKIARDAARALAFLHGKQVVHRLFSSSCVLLDTKFNAKVSDYLFSRLGPVVEYDDDNESIFHDFVGQERPERSSSGHMRSTRPKNSIPMGTRAEDDIWGFGIFLCELITGSDHVRNEDEHAKLVKKHLSDEENLKAIIDPTLKEKYQFESAKILVNIAKMCLRKDPEFRPSMKVVATMLSGIVGSRMDSEGSRSRELK